VFLSAPPSEASCRASAFPAPWRGVHANEPQNAHSPPQGADGLSIRGRRLFDMTLDDPASENRQPRESVRSEPSQLIPATADPPSPGERPRSVARSRTASRKPSKSTILVSGSARSAKTTRMWPSNADRVDPPGLGRPPTAAAILRNPLLDARGPGAAVFPGLQSPKAAYDAKPARKRSSVVQSRKALGSPPVPIRPCGGLPAVAGSERPPRRPATCFQLSGRSPRKRGARPALLSAGGDDPASQRAGGLSRPDPRSCGSGPRGDSCVPSTWSDALGARGRGSTTPRDARPGRSPGTPCKLASECRQSAKIFAAN
jgi:hypothetical protein